MAVVLALTARGVTAASNGIALVVPDKDQGALIGALRVMARESAPDPVELARLVPEMKRSKYDAYLGGDLLTRCYASEYIDGTRVPAIAADLLARLPPS